MNALAEQNFIQQENLRPQLLAGLQQAETGETKDFDAVFDRLEKKYSQLIKTDKKL